MAALIVTICFPNSIKRNLRWLNDFELTKVPRRCMSTRKKQKSLHNILSVV